MSQWNLGTVSAEIAINQREAGGYTVGQDFGAEKLCIGSPDSTAFFSLKGTRHSQLR